MHLNRFKNIPLEPIFWLFGLIVLACMDPHAGHVSVCPLENLGMDFCPGCGIGKSISYLFHGSLIESWRAHPLGGFAVAVLIFRIFTCFKTYIHSYGKNN